MKQCKNKIIREASEIISIMSAINTAALKEAEMKEDGYLYIILTMNIRTSHGLSDKQSYVIKEIGGSECIMKVTTMDPCDLEYKVIEQLEKYESGDIKPTRGSKRV